MKVEKIMKDLKRYQEDADEAALFRAMRSLGDQMAHTGDFSALNKLRVELASDSVLRRMAIPLQTIVEIIVGYVACAEDAENLWTIAKKVEDDGYLQQILTEIWLDTGSSLEGADREIYGHLSSYIRVNKKYKEIIDEKIQDLLDLGLIEKENGNLYIITELGRTVRANLIAWEQQRHDSCF